METLQSPRIENDTIYWYEGDAFYLNFSLSNSETNESIYLQENDKIVVRFYSCNCRLVCVKEITEQVGEFYPIHIDSKLTTAFSSGKYHYDIELHRNNSETIQTILEGGKIEVQGCKRCRT